MNRSRAALILTTALVVAAAGACSGNGDKKSKDASVGADLPAAKNDIKTGKEAGGKDLAVDLKPDKTVNPDLPAPKDLYNLSGEWMPCHGLTGYDNTCGNMKTGFACCRGTYYPPSPNACPPGLTCGHYDCFNVPDASVNSRPCPVGSYCVSPSRCWCSKSKGWCGACDTCSKACNLLPQCPTKP